MWLINVVLIITFIYFLFKLLRSINKQNRIVIFIIIDIAVIFEVLFIGFNILDKTLPSFVQVLVLLFSYILPIITIMFNDTNLNFRLKILYAVANISYTLKKYEFVDGLLEQAIKKDKNNSKLYYLRARCLEKLGKFEGARDMLFNVIEIDRTNKKAYLKLVQFLDMEDKKDTALVILSGFLKMYPDDTYALELLGIIYSEIGQEKEAQKIYENLSRDNKGTYNTYYNLAIVYSRQGQIQNAIDAYKIAIEKNNKLYEAYYALGKLYYVCEEYIESIKNIKMSLKDNYLKPRAHFALSMSYIKLGKLEKAVDHLEEAVRLDNTYLTKAKNDEMFDIISLDIKRLEDERKELLTYTYNAENELEEKTI